MFKFGGPKDTAADQRARAHRADDANAKRERLRQIVTSGPWIPLGAVIPLLLGAIINKEGFWVIAIFYPLLNLTGTIVFLDVMEDPSVRTQRVMKAAFVLQLPFGILSLLLDGI